VLITVNFVFVEQERQPAQLLVANAALETVRMELRLLHFEALTFDDLLASLANNAELLLVARLAECAALVRKACQAHEIGFAVVAGEAAAMIFAVVGGDGLSAFQRLAARGAVADDRR